MIIRLLAQEEPFPMDLLLLADPEEKLVQAYLAKGRSYVAEAEGGGIGIYVLMPTGPRTAEIMNIAVAEPMQGQGIGTALLQHAIHSCRELGLSLLEIRTGNSSIGQLALYQKNGFRMVDIELDYFVNHYSEPIFENGIQCRDRIRLQQYV